MKIGDVRMGQAVEVHMIGIVTMIGGVIRVRPTDNPRAFSYEEVTAPVEYVKPFEGEKK